MVVLTNLLQAFGTVRIKTEEKNLPKLKKRLLILFSISIFSLLSLALVACEDYIKNSLYTVMVPDGIGYTVTSSSVVDVQPNDSAVFNIEICDGYEFIYASHGKYEDGKLIIENVSFSSTINFVVRLSEEIGSVENGAIEVVSSGGGAAIYGEPAEFLIIPNDNYVVEEVFLNNENYEFSREPNGTVVVRAVYDEYVSVKAKCMGKECNILCEENEFGTVKLFSEREIPRYDDTVRIECIANENYRTVYLEVGGDRVYGRESYEFVVKGDVNISARFADSDSPVIVYDYNGAEYDKDGITFDIARAGEFIYLQNGFGMWTHEGYTLESWNTEPDGSGERHALGAMIAMPSQDTVYYAQYKRQTDPTLFGYREWKNHLGEVGYQIVSYDKNAKYSEVVLPDSYNGIKVFSVGDGVFEEVHTIHSIVTNTNIEAIGEKAFANMQNLKEIFLYDSLRNLADTALVGSPINKLHINSAGRRIYEKILETNIVDKHMLVKTSKRQKIVTLSGCSMAKGMCSEMFYEDEYLKDFDVIHTGVNARYGLGMLMEMTDAYLNAGDIVVLALENYEHLWLTDEGMELANKESADRLKHFESNYDIYEEFNLAATKEINDILSVLPKYFSERATDLDRNYTAAPTPNRDMMNEHGDYTYFRPNATYLPENIQTLYPSMSFLDGLDRINAWVQKQMDKGVRVCFIFPPIYRYKQYDDPAHAELRENFMAGLRENAIFPILGTIDDAALPVWCFSDWINHPSTEGTKVYTERFIELLSSAIADGVI